MRKWKCSVCGYIYDEMKGKTTFEELPEDWTCPQCGAPKSAFGVIEGAATVSGAKTTVADKMVEQLVAYGVKRVYGIPGHSNLPLTEAFRRNPSITRSTGSSSPTPTLHRSPTLRAAWESGSRTRKSWMTPCVGPWILPCRRSWRSSSTEISTSRPSTRSKACGVIRQKCIRGK